MTTGNILLKIAGSKEEFEDGQNLFHQYADSLGIDLGFQDFANELKIIDRQYNKPKGALLLAYSNTIPLAVQVSGNLMKKQWN
ncbi:MAG: hypothetical protein ABUT20_64360 [Bacteroidota bacterium]